MEADLRDAIRSNDPSRLRELLAVHGLGDATSSGGRLLELAVLEQRHECCAALLSARADVTNPRGGPSCVHLAACTGDAKLLRMLLAAAPEAVNLANGDLGMTPLMHAAQFGHVSACEALLELGADPMLVDALDRSASSFASAFDASMWRKGLEYRAWREQLAARADELNGVGAGEMGGDARDVRPLLCAHGEQPGPEPAAIPLTRPSTALAHAGLSASDLARLRAAAAAEPTDGAPDERWLLASPLALGVNWRGEPDLALPVYASFPFKRLSTGALPHAPALGLALGELRERDASQHGTLRACADVSTLSRRAHASLHGVRGTLFAGDAREPEPAPANAMRVPARPSPPGARRPLTAPAAAAARGGVAPPPPPRVALSRGNSIASALSRSSRAQGQRAPSPPGAPRSRSPGQGPGQGRAPSPFASRGLADPLQLEVRRLEDAGQVGAAVLLVAERLRLDRQLRPKAATSWRSVAERRPPAEPLCRSSTAVAGRSAIGAPLRMQSASTGAHELQALAVALPPRERSEWAPHFVGSRLSRPPSAALPPGADAAQARAQANPLQDLDVVRSTLRLQQTELAQLRAQGLRQPRAERSLSELIEAARAKSLAVIAAAAEAAEALAVSEAKPAAGAKGSAPKPKGKGK